MVWVSETQDSWHSIRCLTKVWVEKKATGKGLVYIKIQKGMYGLLQVGLLAQELLEQWLARNGYIQCKLTLSLWPHHIRSIPFCLVADDFSVKYVGQENAKHLYQILAETYKIMTDWGEKYIGLTLQWDYWNKEVHLSLPRYVQRALM